ncbi:lantibiotic dehydratase [Streptomyces varsoviensis]|uniref:lantibiotic dehydratase n=1 Tax=Streptomyces varsoviensis TaxID=67373 RepID=UPI0009981D05|nr:lantibiotic dehydratase [Streptomyces varsoviensis]
MNAKPFFACADFAMLRAPVHPAHRALDTCPDVAEGAPDEADRLIDYLRRAAAEPLLREAVSVSSSSLGRVLDRIAALDRPDGSRSDAPTPASRPAPGPPSPPPPSIAELRRAARALTGYRLRMAARCTPFGLMAGVATATFAEGGGEAAKVRFGTEHRRAVRPDRQWLTALLTDWERRPELLRQLRVTLNNLCFVRGRRLVLPYLPHAAGQPQSHRTVHEVSVRHTPALRLVTERARGPVRFSELERQLLASFPGASAEAVRRMLTQLVEKDILLTEARPPLEATDPLGHVLDVLGALPDASAVPELAELLSVRDALGDYARQEPGRGLAAWRAVTGRMARLRPAERLVQVDLALDADVTLPREVAAEAERAARLLWRLAPEERGPAHLRRYHEEFLERYSTDRLVPVKELLDPDIGLGAPAGYNMPPSHRFPRPEGVTETGRDRLLTELAQGSLLAGAAEVVLADDGADPVIRALSRSEGTPPASLELWTKLLADSPAALQAGDFRLVVTAGSQTAGGMFGRFAYLLPDETRAALAALARSVGHPNPEALPAQLTYQTSHSRSGNVSQVPQWLERKVPVAVYADPAAPGHLDLADLAVGADIGRLFVVDRRSGREVVPTAFHMLDSQWQAPNAARFLREISLSGVRRWRPWDWGLASHLPFLPRVRCGRTVLSQARWRATEAVRDAESPFERWAEAVAEWRSRWRVPERVCLSFSDQRLELDLTRPQHLRLLRRELGRRPGAELYEVEAGAEQDAGWLTGPLGTHRNEVVFPMVTRYGPRPARPAATTRPRDRLSPPRPAPAEHLPGGEWLYASVYCAAERQDELIATELPSLLHSLPPEGIDRWFFLRYRDQEQPQLRLRLHGDPGVLTAQGLPRLNEWVAGLRASGLARRLILDTYDPEAERYGGAEAIDAAERAFHADSLAVLEQLRLLDTGRLTVDPLLLAAANYVDLIRAFWPDDAGSPTPDGEPQWVRWLLGSYAKHGASAAYRVFRKRRRDAVALIDPYGDWASLRERPGGEAVLAAFARRAPAVAEYGRVLRRLSPPWAPPPQILNSLFHMHHNRLIGIDREGEQATYAIARGAVQAHRDRRRHNG